MSRRVGADLDPFKSFERRHRNVRRERDVIGLGGVFTELADSLLGYELAVADKAHSVADLLDFTEVVATEEDGGAAGLGGPHLVEKDLLHQRVQAAGRFI